MTHGPSASRSFAISRTKIDVLGNISPHIACTAKVIRPSGAWGNSTTMPATTKQSAEDAVEALGVAQSNVESLIEAIGEVAHGVTTRQRDRGGADDRRVQQDDGEEVAGAVPDELREAVGDA